LLPSHTQLKLASDRLKEQASKDGSSNTSGGRRILKNVAGYADLLVVHGFIPLIT
jgi:hypothetical protein